MLNFTDRARDMVLSFMDQSGEDICALRIHFSGGSPVAPSFELTLIEQSDRADEDLEIDAESFTVVVDPGSAEKLDGATVDFVNRVNGSGFEIIPAVPSMAAALAHATRKASWPTRSS